MLEENSFTFASHLHTSGKEEDHRHHKAKDRRQSFKYTMCDTPTARAAPSKQYDHAHTFHRSNSSVGLVGVDGEFPVTRAAIELMHHLRRKNTTMISPALWLLSFHCSS